MILITFGSDVFLDCIWTAHIQTEFSELSEYKIRKAIKEAFNYSKNNTTQLELFNANLITDALDLITECEGI